MPGELSISSTLLGPENRTLVRTRSANNGLDLIPLDFDISVFSNETVYNLSFIQINNMDVVQDYSVTAQVSFTNRLYYIHTCIIVTRIDCWTSLKKSVYCYVPTF